MVDTLEGECCVEDARTQNGKLGRAARCKPVLKKQEDSCPHINGKGGDCWDIATYVAAALL